MKLRNTLCALLAIVVLLSSIPFVSAAASATVESVDGQRTAFVSSFGKMSYNGKSYVCYKTFPEAFKALGAEGGRIVFNGTIDLTNFEDVEGRGPIVIEGVGTKSQGNLLHFKEMTEVNLKGDLRLIFCNIRLEPEAYLYTNGFSFDTAADFDTYHVEHYVATGPNEITYDDPPSMAPGTVSAGQSGVIYLNAGHYLTLAAGSVNGKAVNGDTNVMLEGGEVGTLVAGNVGNGTMNGSPTLTLGKGVVDELIAGSAGGTVNGNVRTVINGGSFHKVTIGAAAGATINGSVIVALNGGSFDGTIGVGSGTVTGKKIVITGADATAKLADGCADYVIKLTGGLCEPQTNGAEVSGFKFTDNYGIPAKTITLNGAAVSSDNGIYQLSAGTNTVEVKSAVNVALNRSAKYVAGYEDGTFLPQKNMTRAEAITLLSRLVTDENNIKGYITCSYDDVPAGSWFESYIGFFQKQGYLDEIEYNHGLQILPNQFITRAEFVQLIYEIAQVETETTSVKLKEMIDVDDKTEHAPAIYFAVSEGIVTGYEDGSFKPEGNITRAEVVTIVNRFVGREPTGNAGDTNFSDIGDHWAKGQILAACNAEGTSWTAKTASDDKYVLTGNKAEDYIKALYEQSEHLSGDAIREASDIIAEQMKKDVLNTKDELVKGGDVYYISEKNGDDKNDGKTPETAWKTIANLRNPKKFAAIKKGTCVLFERGGIYRGQISTTSGVSYGAYGEGEKPLLMESPMNFADPKLWEETEWPNVYKCTKKLVNVGVMGFDHDLFDHSDKTYDEKYGIIMNLKTFGFTGPQDLCGDLQFYSVLPKGSTSTAGDLYLYSKDGNPGERFKDIEIGENIQIMTGAANDVTIDNLAFKFTGGHGMGSAGGCKNRVVQNCVYSWIGGSVLSFNGEGQAVTNYGNAIEIYGSCNGYRVENCWIYQIYDTAVTHQYSSESACIHDNVEYLSNLMEYVFWGIEFYNAPPAKIVKNSKTKYTRNVHDAYNLLRLGGYGWGSIVRYRSSRLYCGSSLSENYNELTEYNIFDRAYGYLLTLPSNAEEVQDKNIYIQFEGQTLGALRGSTYTCGYNAAQLIREKWGDKNGVVVVIDTDKEPIVRKLPEGLK